MGTFAIIFIILCFISGMMSRSKTTIIRDNDNAHLFDNTDFKPNPNINKKDLKEEIKVEYEKGNYYNSKKLIDKYLYYYQPDIQILIMMTFSEIEMGNIEGAEKYANQALYEYNHDKYGYYLKGCVEYSRKNYKKCSDYFYSAIDYGLPVQWIKDAIPDEYTYNTIMNLNK